MEECDRPESTARAKINAFQATDDNLYSYHRSDKKVYFDYDKFNDLEDEIDHWLDIETNDYRGEQRAQLKSSSKELSKKRHHGSAITSITRNCESLSKVMPISD